MATRPKTGEKRKVRQPMSIDRLPIEVRDKIVQLRGPKGRTWPEIEELSKDFVPWSKLPNDVAKLFPGKYLPMTNLHRWYDVRVEQVMRQNEQDRAFALEIAGAFKTAGFDGLDESVKNMLAKEVFQIARSSQEKDKTKLRGNLMALYDLLTKNQRVAVQKGKLELERQKLELVKEKVTGLKKDVARKKQMDPAALQQRLDEIYGLTK